MKGESGEAFFNQLCAGIRAASHVEEDEESIFYELPFRYADGTEIALKVDSDGRVSDDGRTLLRFQAEGRLTKGKPWDEFLSFQRVHAMVRDGTELVFSGKNETDLIHYLEGLRDLELRAPVSRESAKSFCDIISNKVKVKIQDFAKEKKLEEEVADQILNPTLVAKVELEDRAEFYRVDIPVQVDFMNADGSEYYVLLDDALEQPGSRANYIKRKLAESHLLSERDPPVIPVMPSEGYSGLDEDLILALSRHAPLVISGNNARPLIKRIIGVSGHRSEAPFKMR